MKFYSYEYLQEHILSANIFQTAILIIFFGIVIFSIFMYFKSNGDSKYRELIILFMIAIVLFICLKINDYRNFSAINSSYYDSINIVEKASEKLGLPKNEIYVTRSNDNNLGVVIKTKDWYYRVIKSGNTYIFEKINILNPDIQLVEVKK
jgi:Protein of unknown function (DUF3290).